MPRLVETRSMLLSAGSRVRGDTGQGHYVVWEDDLAALVGRPDPELVRAALSDAPRVRDLLAMRDAIDLARATLPEWPAEEAVVHSLPDPPPDWPLPGPEAAFLGARTSLSHLEPALADEIASALSWGPVAAAWADERPVAFCYASSLTESLWDVSIDTAPAYRRRGLAQSALHLMAAFQRENARMPVWGAAIGNLASMQLASRMGFVPVDTLFVLSRPHR